MRLTRTRLVPDRPSSFEPSLELLQRKLPQPSASRRSRKQLLHARRPPDLGDPVACSEPTAPAARCFPRPRRSRWPDPEPPIQGRSRHAAVALPLKLAQQSPSSSVDLPSTPALALDDPDHGHGATNARSSLASISSTASLYLQPDRGRPPRPWASLPRSSINTVQMVRAVGSAPTARMRLRRTSCASPCGRAAWPAHPRDRDQPRAGLSRPQGKNCASPSAPRSIPRRECCVMTRLRGSKSSPASTPIWPGSSASSARCGSRPSSVRRCTRRLRPASRHPSTPRRGSSSATSRLMAPRLAGHQLAAPPRYSAKPRLSSRTALSRVSSGSPMSLVNRIDRGVHGERSGCRSDRCAARRRSGEARAASRRREPRAVLRVEAAQ